MNFIRAAEAVGLGCCPISVIRNIDEVAELLELPDFVFPVAGMTAGYPSEDGYLSLRLPPAVNVHINSYNDSQLEPEIDSYDKRETLYFQFPRKSSERLKNLVSQTFMDGLRTKLAKYQVRNAINSRLILLRKVLI